MPAGQSIARSRALLRAPPSSVAITHPGSASKAECVQEILPPAVSMAPSPQPFPRTPQKAGADSLARPHPCRTWCPCYAHDFVTGPSRLLGNYVIHISAVSLSRCSFMSLTVVIEPSKHTLKRQPPAPAAFRPSSSCLGGPKASHSRTWLEMGEGTYDRSGLWHLSLHLSFHHGSITVTIQANVCSHMGAR